LKVTISVPSTIALTLVAALAACESAPPTSAAEAQAEAPAASAPPRSAAGPAARIDLDATGASIRDGKVKNAKELETAINRQPGNRVDVDGDGRPDQLQVVEDPRAKRRRFHVRALPSSKKQSKPDEVAVPVASMELEPLAEQARVTLRHVGDEVGVVAFEAPIVVDTFCHWVLVVERPIFIGAAYVVVHEVVHRAHHKHKKFKHGKHKHKKW
jgi:hypothetical protein